jgi:hypothetical protein
MAWGKPMYRIDVIEVRRLYPQMRFKRTIENEGY